MKKSNWTMLISRLGLYLLLLSSPIWLVRVSAQSVYGSITGTVTDPTSAAVAGAAVTLTNEATNERHTMMTDASGNYTFVNLAPGQYDINVDNSGFKHFTRRPIEVQVQSAIRVDATLQLGDAAQTVEVSAETPLLQTQSATIGHEVEQRQVQDLALN